MFYHFKSPTVELKRNLTFRNVSWLSIRAFFSINLNIKYLLLVFHIFSGTISLYLLNVLICPVFTRYLFACRCVVFKSSFNKMGFHISRCHLTIKKVCTWSFNVVLSQVLTSAISLAFLPPPLKRAHYFNMRESPA